MRLATTCALFLMAVALMVGSAGATHFDYLNGQADCDGWQADGAARFGQVDQQVTVQYDVELSQDGSVVAADTGSLIVVTGGYDSHVPFSTSGSWGIDLCGTYSVAGTFVILAAANTDTATFTAEVNCECPTSDCYLTPGYWKNHDWPVDELTVGGVTSSRDELLAILWEPVRGDATIILAHHLIAAKLNVAAGADGSINDAIDAADEYLLTHPVGSKPHGAAKQQGTALKDELAAYNEQGCPGEDKAAFAGDAVQDQQNSVETRTWSGLKNTYR